MIQDIVARNPRFKQTLGEVTFPANTIMKWKDVWVSVTSVTTSGTRLSPNYFMCTQIGRAILAKVGDKDGQFIEWTRETDKTRQTPTAGVYYLNVDFFDDQSRAPRHHRAQVPLGRGQAAPGREARRVVPPGHRHLHRRHARLLDWRPRAVQGVQPVQRRVRLPPDPDAVPLVHVRHGRGGRAAVVGRADLRARRADGVRRARLRLGGRREHGAPADRLRPGGTRTPTSCPRSGRT